MVKDNAVNTSQSEIVTGHIQPQSRPPRTKSVVTFVSVCVVIAVALTIWIAQASFYSPTPPTVSTLNQILAYTEAHEQSASDGALVIPANLASESITWRSYITKAGDTTYVFVPSWIGRKTDLPLMKHADNWVEGYLYSANTLPTQKDSSNSQPINLNVPAETIPEHATLDQQTRNVAMNVVKHVGTNWYQVTLAQ